MLVLDATRSVAASGVVLTPLSASWGGAFPQSFQAVESFVTTRLGATAWDAALGSALALPGWVVFAALALAFHAAIRRPEPSRYRAAS